jgi:hypothetical protein
MIPSTLTLLVAATSSVLSVNALPVLSGFFSRNTPASPAAALARRDLTSAQLAQGSNEFFKSLLFEDVCTPGQVACINNNTASCSGEGNWEITPCTGGTTCLALPVDSTSTSTSNSTVVVECTNPATALTAIEQAGGSQDLAVNFSVTAAPFNATVTATPTASSTNSSSSFGFVPTATDSSTDAPTSTDNGTAPTSTCTDDGSYDGSDDGPNDGETDSETPTPTLGADVPTGTDASTDPTGTCSEDPEPTETEFITVIAFPNPTNSSQFSYSTIEPTETDSSNSTDATPTTDAYGSYPTDSTDVPAPTDSGNSTLPDVSPAPESISPDNSTVTATDGSTDPTSTDGNSTSPTTTTPGAPISTLGTFDIPAPQTFSDTGGFSVVSGPAPDVSVLGTSEIPAPTTTGTPTRRGMQKKVRRS